ncbi:hypothetical protein [Brevundimonas sp.]|uniref:hypothetical protein n=1 Tax=Brevundimonas sp. TaxID=1871086 RepID=UPI003F720238
MNLTVLLFLLFLTIVALSATWSDYLSRQAAETTIRRAIDQGVLLDAELITRLRAPYRPRWHVRLVVGGLIITFVGAGVGLFGVLLGVDSPKALFPVLAIGGGTFVIGLGVLLGGLCIQRFPIN